MKRGFFLLAFFIGITTMSFSQSFSKIFGGEYSSSRMLAIGKDSSLWIWGSDTPASGFPTSYNTPQKISNEKWLSGEYIYAIKANGTLWKWTDASFTDAPTQVGTSTNWKKVVIGELHYVGLKSDSTLWTWGSSNQLGQQGNGTNKSNSAPTQIAVGSKWTDISTGEVFSVALKSDSTLWTWGSDLYQELGNGATSTSVVAVPTQISTDKWISISTGRNTIYAINKDHTLWTCGLGEHGEMGNGTMTQMNPSLIQMGTANDWKTVAAGSYHAVGLRMNGDVYTWGWNAYGEIGNGTETMQLTPLKVASSAVGVAAGYSLSFYLHADGTFCTSGYNYGAQGLGSSSTYTTSFNCSTTADIAETTINKSITVYPNPTSNTFEVTGFEGSATINLYDISGKQILSTDINSSQDISMKNLPQGVYVIKLLTSEGNSWNGKIVKQ